MVKFFGGVRVVLFGVCGWWCGRNKSLIWVIRCKCGVNLYWWIYW